MNNRGQFTIIAALLVAIVLAGTLIAVYATIRYESSQSQTPQTLTATDETNSALLKALGFTVGYYGSILQVTGNQTYAYDKSTIYMDSALQYISSMNPSLGESINMTSLKLSTTWFSNPSVSTGTLSVVYDLADLSIYGVSYTTSCSLGVQIFNSPSSNQVCVNVTQDLTEPLTSLSQQNFAFYFYNYSASNWQLINPSLTPTIFTNGTYLINVPSEVTSSAFMVQVTDSRGIMVEAASFNSYNLNFAFSAQSSSAPTLVELLQNGTMLWSGQDLLSTGQTQPIPPIPVSSLNLCPTGSTSDIPFQVEDWASGYKIPLGLTSNYTIFSDNQMIVFEVSPSMPQLTLWWNGSDTAIQPSAAYTDTYFTNDNSGAATLSNGNMTLQFSYPNGVFQVTATVGNSAGGKVISTADFMRIDGSHTNIGSGSPAYIIQKGVVRDIVQEEAEWNNGPTNCPNVYSQMVITLPANATYYTYQLRLIFINGTQIRTITDISPIQLSTSATQLKPMTENGINANGIPIISTTNGYFYNSTGAHQWSELINNALQGTGIMFTASENQQLYAFDKMANTFTGALYISNSTPPDIELDPVTSAGSVSFTSALDLTWYGDVATFNGANPIYPTSGNSGLWTLVEQPPTVTITPESTATTSINLSPSIGPVGTSVTVSGNGFTPNSKMTITFKGETVATTTANIYGEIPSGITFDIPSYSYGSYFVTATDASSNTAEATFTIAPMETIAFQPVGIGSDAGTSPILTIDSVQYTLSTLPSSFNWPAGSTHTITASSTVAAGTGKQYVWASWSDGGAQTHTYTVPTSGATITVDYYIQYFLAVSSAYGSPTGQGWYNASSTANFGIGTLVAGGSGIQYAFASWTGSGTGSYSGATNPDSAVMNNTITETAGWNTQYQVTFAVTPTGTGTTTPSSATWYNAGVAGQSITANANSGYTFLYWSASPTGSVTFANSGSASTTMTVNSANAVVKATFALISGPLANFAFSTIGTQTAGTAFQITVTAQDANGITVTSYSGTPTLTYSAGTINPATIGPFVYGVWTGLVTVTTPGTSVAITATGNGESGTSNRFEVTSALTLDTSNQADADTSTVQITLTTSQPNDLIYVSAAVGNAQSFGSITSSPSLTWTSRATVPGAADTLESWAAIMPTSGLITINIVVNTGPGHWAAAAFAVSGANTASPFDGTAQINHADSGTAIAPITTTHANDFVIGTVETSSNNALTTGTGYTSIVTGEYAGYREVSDEYQVGSTTGTYTPSFTFTGTNWDMIADAVQPAVGPLIALTPTSGAVGSTVTVSGSDFAANSLITVKFDGTTVATPTSTAAGAIPSGVTFTVPSATSGAQTVTVTDAYSNSATATFTIPASISLSPTSGAVGSTVTVTATGMVGSQLVTATFGGTAVTLSPSTTGSTGGLSATFTVPASTSGSKTVQVSDGTNSPTASFTVTSAISLSPTTGIVGSSVTVTATGMLGSHAGVTATFGGAAVTLSATTTTSTGGLSATFTVPASTSGAQTVKLSDGTNLPTASFTVTPAITLSPTSGGVYSTVTVSGSGFAASSTITIKFAGTAQTTSPSTVTTSSSGSIPSGVTFTVPSVALGAQTVTATDTYSNSATATFTVTDAPVVVTSNFNDGGGSPVTVTLTTTQPNDLLYVSATVGVAQSFVSITSSPSLTWHSRATISNSADTLETWWAIMSTSGSINISVTVNNNNGHWAAAAFAVSGANLASPFDGNAKTYSGTTSPASASITTTHANDLIIGTLDAASSNTLTTGTGFTLITTGVYGGIRQVSDEYEAVSSIGTYTPTYTFTSTNWNMIADAIQGVP